MKLVSFCEDYLVADYLRLELGDLEDYLGLSVTHHCGTRNASACDIGITQGVPLVLAD